MSLPSISIINFSTNLFDDQVQEVIRAINRQVIEDFMPIWGSGRILRLHAPTFNIADEETLADDPVRGESVIYLVDEATLPGALGYHARNTRGIPFGFVFTDFIENWTVTLSHEVLELIVDPTANVLVPGSDPRNPANMVLHTYEVCDAVERTSYQIDQVPVSNFITPVYFTEGDEAGTRNDFLGVGVDSFRATPDSHLAFFDLATNEWVQILGNQVPASTIQASRVKKFDRQKQERPKEEQLHQILAACKEKQKGLGQVNGISRTSRYQQGALRLRAKSQN